MDKDSEEYKKFRERANRISRRYYLKNKDKINVWHKEYRRNPNNIFKLKEYHKKYYQLNKERYKQWREENKDYLKEYDKKRRQEHSEERKLKNREYSKKIWKDPLRRPKLIERQTIFRKKYPDKVKQCKQKYYHSENGLLQYKKYNHKRMSRNHNCKFQLTKEQIKEIFERDKCCVYCGSSIKLSLDHIISLSNGGEGIFYNFVIACHDCNCSKNNKNVFEWCKSKNKEVPKIVIECLNK